MIVSQKTNIVNSKPKIRGQLLMIWFGRCLEIGTILMQKCMDDKLIRSVSAASVSAVGIMISSSYIERQVIFH